MAFEFVFLYPISVLSFIIIKSKICRSACAHNPSQPPPLPPSERGCVKKGL